MYKEQKANIGSVHLHFQTMLYRIETLSVRGLYIRFAVNHGLSHMLMINSIAECPEDIFHVKKVGSITCLGGNKMGSKTSSNHFFSIYPCTSQTQIFPYNYQEVLNESRDCKIY